MTIDHSNSLVGRWRAKAACRDEDPELFFPIGTTGPALDQIERAKEIYARCLVRRQCLQRALDTHQPTGIWGGRETIERHALRRIQRVRR